MNRKKQKRVLSKSRPARTRRRPHSGRESSRPERLTENEQEIMALLHKSGKALTAKELLANLDLPQADRKKLTNILASLCARRIISCTEDKKTEKGYSLRKAADLLEGTISMHPRGFGFAVIAADDQPGKPSAKNDRQDMFIAPDNLGTARQGDRVLLRETGQRRGRPEAEVVRVLTRFSSRVVGKYVAGATGMVIPENERLFFNVVVRKEKSCGARNGEAVVVEITDYKSGRRNPHGEIIEVLGDPADIEVQTDMVIRKFDLPHTFSEPCLKEAKKLSAKMPAEDSRTDLRDILHVTIDGETARDFDDAVAVLKTSQGFRLYVSIADVSHYVRPGSNLDQEAYQRGTSVYFPTRVLPMLPERLSNDLCSLVPDKDRPAFTAILDFDRAGRRRAKKFTKSIIRSRFRLTYTLAGEIMEKQKKTPDRIPEELQPVHAIIKHMADLALLLEKQRADRGSIGFTLPEAQLAIDENGRITDVARAVRNAAHKAIEEFMLAANEAVAEILAEQHRPALYRIHEEPEAEKIIEFTEFAHNMGLQIPPNTGTPDWFGKILALAAGTPKEYIINNLLLRAMQRARYSPNNVGHFGLAASHYTHFTSPIRRYPDLMVHRALEALLHRSQKGPSPNKLVEDGDFLSGRERTAVDADREMIDRLKIQFMADKLGESFDGVISGVRPFGLFVELLRYFISGAIPMEDLGDDYYQFDEKNHRLVGANTGRIFQIGDTVRVTVARVDQGLRRINFVLEEAKGQRTKLKGRSKWE